MDITVAVAMVIIHILTQVTVLVHRITQLKIISQVVLRDNFKVMQATLMLRFPECNIYNVVF